MSHIITTGYSNLICTTTFDNVDKKVGEVSKQPVDANLTFATFDPDTKSLYCVHELSNHEQFKGSGAVSRWQFDQDKKAWVRKEMVTSGGADPAHIALDRKRGLLFITNYTGGSFIVLKIDKAKGGAIQTQELPVHMEEIKDGSKVVPSRQDAAHLHGTFLFKDFVYVVDLGSDKILHYQIMPKEDGQGYWIRRPERAEVAHLCGVPAEVDGKEPLNDHAETKLSPGSGPRHMVIDEKRLRAYVINELKPIISVFNIDVEFGVLTHMKDVEIRVSNQDAKIDQYPSGIDLHPSGNLLYISNRGTGAIVVFAIGDSAQDPLHQVGDVPSGGTWPRHFSLSPDGLSLFVADQHANLVKIFKVDPSNGSLAEAGSFVSDNKPSLVLPITL